MIDVIVKNTCRLHIFK